jgi:hypothetical protein
MTAVWLYLISGALILIGVVVGFIGGGIFTIVLIPLGLLVLIAGSVLGAGGRKAQKSGGGGAEETHTSDAPLPHQPAQSSGRAPTSPEGLADARRTQQ